MKNLHLTLVTFLFSPLLLTQAAGCSTPATSTAQSTPTTQASSASPAPGNGEVRNVATFTELEVSGAFEVSLRQGTPQSVRLEGDAQDLAQIVTEVKGNALRVHPKEENGWFHNRNSGTIKLFITVENLNSVELSGSTRLVTENTLKADHFSLEVSGSDNVTLALDVNEFKSEMSGSAILKLSGRAVSQKLEISGSGRVEAFDLASDNIKVEASGSARLEVDAEKKLDVDASGSIHVEYKGAGTVNVDASGSSSVKKIG